MKKIIGTWEPESENAAYDRITFSEDGIATWVIDGEETENIFVINERDQLLYANNQIYVWDLSQQWKTYIIGEGWSAEKETVRTWGFSDFEDNYNLFIQGQSYVKTFE